MLPRRHRARRTRVAAGTLALVSLVTLSACTSGDDPSGSKPSTPGSSGGSPSSTSSGGPVTLRFAVYGGRQEVAAYRRLAAAYTREHPRVSVEVEVTGDPATAEVELDRQFDAGTAPDLFLSDATALPTLLAFRRVQPVDQLLEDRGVQFGDNYERLGLEAFAGQDALQCMPSDVSPSVVFYNRRLFGATALVSDPEAPLRPVDGWKWVTFVEAARQMSQPGVKGVYLPPDLTTLTPLLRSAGADVVDDAKKPTSLQLSDGPARAALEEILAVVRDPDLTPTAAELADQDALSRFESGRLAMMVGTRALVPVLRAHSRLRFDVFPLPSLGSSQTVADVSGYCISRTSQHVADAADLLAFATGAKGGKIMARSGAVVPANIAALHSPAFEQPGRLPLHADVFANVMRRADTMPNPPGWPLVVSRTQPLLDRLYHAPVLDLDTLLPRIDRISATILAPPTATPSPSDSPSGSPSESPAQ